MYDFEGQESPVGSVGCCSLLEADNDLQFLDDLGPKFKTLAEVCGGKEANTEVKPVLNAPLNMTTPKAIDTTTTVRSIVSTRQQQPQPQLQPQPQPQPLPSLPPEPVTTSMAGNTSHNSTTVLEGVTRSVQGGMVDQGQTLLMPQQPIYYTTAPAQPMHYIVQPQMQNTMYLTNSPATTNMQGMMVVNGGQLGASQGVILQGQGVGQGGGGVIHTGNLPQGMMLVEGQVPAGSQQMLQGGGQTYLVQGGTLNGGLLGSQNRLVVEGQAIHIEGGGGGVIHTGSLPQGMMVVEGQVPVGSQQMQGHGQTYMVQTGSHGGLSAVGQNRMVVEGQNMGGGSLVHNTGMASESFLQMGASHLPGQTLKNGTKCITTSTTSDTFTPIKSVVHKKRVVTTEKITH